SGSLWLPCPPAAKATPTRLRVTRQPAAARAGQCVFLICTTSLRDAGPPVRAAPFSPLNHGIRVQAEADRDGVVHPLHLRFVQPPHVLSQPPFVQRPDLDRKS